MLEHEVQYIVLSNDFFQFNDVGVRQFLQGLKSGIYFRFILLLFMVFFLLLQFVVIAGIQAKACNTDDSTISNKENVYNNRLIRLTCVSVMHILFFCGQFSTDLHTIHLYF